MIAKIFIIALLVESIVLHEMAHGYVALLFGDQTAKQQGRITFNPIPHIDPLWTIVIPIVAYFLSGGTFIIGGAKPVPVNPFNYRRPVLGDICVSVAGVAANLLIAVIMILLLNLANFISGYGIIPVFSTAIGEIGFGAAGLTEGQAKKEGLEVVVGAFVGVDRHPADFSSARLSESAFEVTVIIVECSAAIPFS